MKNLRKSPILLVLLLLLSSTTYAGGIKFQSLSLEEGIKKAKEENKKLFIDVFATWCGPCKFLSKNVFTDDDLGEFINEHFVALKIDGEKGDGLALMSDFELDSYPTMLFLDIDMSLLRKIVGAVSATEIQAGGNAVIFPESTDLYKLRKKYNEGSRDRTVMSDLVIVLLNEDMDTDDLVAEFMELYPKVDMEIEDEFIIFCLGVTDLDDARLKSFLEKIDTHIENHGDMVSTKVIMMMFNHTKIAVDKEDISLVRKGVEELYPYFEKADENAQDVEELIAYFEEVYEEG